MADEPKVGVKIYADTEEFTKGIKEMATMSADDIARELNESVDDIDLSPFKEQLRSAISEMQGKHIEVMLDLQNVGLDNTMVALGQTTTTMEEIQSLAGRMTMEELQQSLIMANDTIQMTKSHMNELKNSMDTMDYYELQSAKVNMEGWSNALELATQKAKVFGNELSRVKASTDTVTSAQTRLGIATSASKTAQDSFGKSIDSTMSRGTTKLKTFMFGMLGVQSAYALVSKSMRAYIDANPVVKSQVEGITQALASLLAPVLKIVIKLFQQLVKWVMVAVAYISTFMNVIFGTNIAIQTTVKALDNTSKGLKKTSKNAKKTGKDIKEALGLAPFDDLNNALSDTNDNMSDTSTPDLGTIAPPDMSAFDISEYIQPLKEFALWLEKNKVLIQIVTGVVLLLVGAFILFKVITGIIAGINVVLGVMNAILLINPAVLVIMAIIAVLVLLWVYWDEICAFLIATWDVVWGAIKAVVQFTLDLILGIVDGFVFLVVSLWDGMVGLLSVAWDILWGVITTIVKVGVVIIKGIIDAIVDIFKFVIGVIILLWNGFIGILKFAVEAFVTYWKFVWNVISTVFKVIVDSIVAVWNGAITLIRNVATGLWNFLTTSVSNIGNTFKSVFNSIGTTIKGVFEGIKSVFSNVWNWILKQMGRGGEIFSGVVSSVSNVFKGIVNSMIKGINTVISIPFKAINGALGKMKGISLLGMKPFGWLPTISVPKIPQLWQGGDVGASRGGTIVNVAERGKSEMVVPLGTSPDGQAFINKIANRTADELGGSTGGDTNVDMVIQIGEESFGRVAIKAINRVQRNAGKVLVKV